MPLGIVSDDDFEKELDNCSTTRKVLKPEIIDIKRGRGDDNVEVPESLRKIIGETANLEGRKEALEFAKQFGISASSVSAYTAGATSTASIAKPDRELVNHIARAKERLSKKARQKMARALHHITDEKLQDAKVHELALVARNMSAIVKDMEPDNPDSEKDKIVPQFIVYAPQFRDERTFETVIAKD